MFSIIIPLYNKESFVKDTIISVLKQTYSQFEIIIVDDGSTDGSLSVVECIDDERIRVFHKENEGVSIARNYGAEKARYEYLCFLDADDIWMPDFLQNMYNLIAQYPAYHFYGTALDIRYESHVIKVRHGYRQTVVIRDFCRASLFHRKNIICIGTICVKKSLFFTQGGFPPHVKYGEDLDLFLRLSCASPLVYSNKSYFVYEISRRGTIGPASKNLLIGKMAKNWYEYQYPNRLSLWLYTTMKMILLAFSSYIRTREYKIAFGILKNIRLKI
ncbi:MAG: glycosyltransferase family 2 protein [Bacteroidales bacterium]|nr:glycosyltransferase family 2 protein [Bacteroidales bacterium]